MTVYIMGKAQPPRLSEKLQEAVRVARRRQQGEQLARIDGRSYQRVMRMAEDLLLIANAQAEVGEIHPDAAAAARWLADVAEKCRLRRNAALDYERFVSELDQPQRGAK
jgi:hypothetical protein